MSKPSRLPSQTGFEKAPTPEEFNDVVTEILVVLDTFTNLISLAGGEAWGEFMVAGGSAR